MAMGRECMKALHALHVIEPVVGPSIVALAGHEPSHWSGLRLGVATCLRGTVVFFGRKAGAQTPSQPLQPGASGPQHHHSPCVQLACNMRALLTPWTAAARPLHEAPLVGRAKVLRPYSMR